MVALADRHEREEPNPEPSSFVKVDIRFFRVLEECVNHKYGPCPRGCCPCGDGKGVLGRDDEYIYICENHRTEEQLWPID